MTARPQNVADPIADESRVLYPVPKVGRVRRRLTAAAAASVLLLFVAVAYLFAGKVLSVVALTCAVLDLGDRR